MATFRLNIIFSGIDFDDDAVFEALAMAPNITWRSQGSLAFATATVDAPSALKAAEMVTELVSKSVSTARPIRLDEDLVAISDVASRVGVTREGVRNWANGTRHANFPIPRGVVGDGIKVWAWADVNRWLRDNLHLGDPEQFPSAHDTALINAQFSYSSGRVSSTSLVPAVWRPAETTRLPSGGKIVRSEGLRPAWVGARRFDRTRLTVIKGAHAAA